MHGMPLPLPIICSDNLSKEILRCPSCRYSGAVDEVESAVGAGSSDESGCKEVDWDV